MQMKTVILSGPGCAQIRGRIKSSLLTLCVLNDTAWPQCRALFYEIFLLKFSLQIAGPITFSVTS